MDDENYKNADSPPKKKLTIERAILKEYFNDNWITVIWKVGGACMGLLVFGFSIGF